MTDQPADDGPGVGGSHRALAQPYLLAAPALRQDVSTAVGPEAFLIDLRSQAVIAEFPMSSRSPRYRGGPGWLE